MKQQQLEKALRDIAGAIEYTINYEFGKMGFAVLVFDFNKPGIGNYVSNASRSDMIIALRETANRLKNEEDIPSAQHTTVQ